MLAVVAVYAVVYQPLGEADREASIAGPGSTTSPVPVLPTYQPPTLFPDAGGSQWGAGPPVYTEGQAAAAWWEHAYPEQAVRIRPVAYPIPEHDPLYAYIYDPGFTIPKPAPSPSAPVQAAQGALSEGELNAILQEAGWPEHLWGEAKQIAWCESRWRPGAVGDGGNSLGAFQLWYGWFSKAGYSSADYADPVVNATVARYVYEVRGSRWGGGGGWSCAALVGLH